METEMANLGLVPLINLNSGEMQRFGGIGFALFDHAKGSVAQMGPFLKQLDAAGDQ